MAFTLDISQLISGAVTNLFNSAIVIGLPTTSAKTPVFCLCEVTHESARGAVKLPGNLTQSGEMRARTVIEASTMELDLVFSDIATDKDQNIYRAVQIAVANAALVTNSYASYGLVLPNLSGVAVGYVASCISVLNQIKNYMMPVMLIGAYLPLSVFQQTTPYLSSAWYIEDIGVPHESGKAGVVVTVRLREQFTKKSSTLLGSILSVASETVAPNGGAALGGLF
jgi:hypothetical protein